jgi:hypothetical protein
MPYSGDKSDLQFIKEVGDIIILMYKRLSSLLATPLVIEANLKMTNQNDKIYFDEK